MVISYERRGLFSANLGRKVHETPGVWRERMESTKKVGDVEPELVFAEIQEIKGAERGFCLQ